MQLKRSGPAPSQLARSQGLGRRARAQGRAWPIDVVV